MCIEHQDDKIKINIYMLIVPEDAFSYYCQLFQCPIPLVAQLGVQFPDWEE